MNATTSTARDPGPAIVPDAELVERVLAGDSAAYELVMRRYNRRMFRTARGIVADDSEAEDVVQEAYARAYLKLDQLKDGRHGLGAWLARIVSNEALGRLRRGKRVIFLEDHVKSERSHDENDNDDASGSMASAGPGPEHTAVSDELCRLLEDAIDELPADFRAVFMLRAVEGLSVAETAESLSLRPETVKTRFHRARKRLQQSLEGHVSAQLPAAFQFDGARCDRVVAGVMNRLAKLQGDGPA